MFDFLVIGAGSGGVRFARLLGATGKNVGIIEKCSIGGTCVLRGCIPKKMFVYASSFGRMAHTAQEYGWSATDTTFNITNFMAKKNTELERLSNIYNNILTNNNVNIIRGDAKFIDPHTVVVNDREYKAKNFLIATGSVAKQLNVPGFEYTVDSTQFLNLTNIPNEVLILGGGYIAMEFTNILLSLGVKVTLAITSAIPLRQFDKSISSFMKELLIAQGVKFVDAGRVTRITKTADWSFTVNFSNDSTITTKMIINAIGREPNVDDLNLAAANVEIDNNKAIKVDDYFKTSNPNIYALGDVINKANLTPVATKQAMYLVKYLTDQQPIDFDYDMIPKAVFSYPEVASCGLTEDEAKNRGYTTDIYLSTFKPLKYNIVTSNIKSLFKIVVDAKTQKVLGIHIIDTHAAEIMQGFAVALKMGVTKQQLDDVIGIHPTSAEELVTMYNKL